DRIVPVHLAFIDEHRHGGGGERLGAGSDGEQRIGGDRLFFAPFLHAEALEVDDLVILDDGDGGARDLPGFEGVGHDGVNDLGVDRLCGGWECSPEATTKEREEIPFHFDFLRFPNVGQGWNPAPRLETPAKRVFNPCCYFVPSG